MYNWSIDEEKLRQDPVAYERWRLEQLINFGLSGKRLDREALMKHWSTLKIDPGRRRFLELLLHGNVSTD